MFEESLTVSTAQDAIDAVPRVPLNDGNSIPMLGFGVWQISSDEVVPAVGEAIRAGYRSIDTAQGYDNEEGVGQAIREAEIDRTAECTQARRLLQHDGLLPRSQ